ncbi:MAG: hypothetical protein ACQKBY_00860 [Verrucomicrobiales bacterium]
MKRALAVHPPRELHIFDTFEEAEKAERVQWPAIPPSERMILLENLGKQHYPDERSAPQGLQRILTIVD